MIPGTYQVKADVPGQSSRITQVDLVVDQDKQLDLVLRAATLNPNATLSGDHIKVSSAIRFVGATANPTAQTLTLVNAVADLLEAHVEIKHLRITAHWDNGLPPPLVDELTQLQADAIRKLLVGRGIADGRLTATGVGSPTPVVPNLSPANRARNRRVEFQVE